MELGFTLLDVENLLVQMDVAAAAPPKSDAGAASSTLEPGSPLAAPHGDVPNLSAGATDCRYVRVLHDLCVHGEAWKLGGSPHWRVLSDARVKRVLGPFAPGGETLGKLKPRVFRYKGQPGHEAPFAGIIAQELPEELAPHCRFRTPLKQLRAGHGAAATLRHATAPSRPSPEAGAAVPSVPAAPTSPVSSSPPEAHLAAVPLPWVRDLSGTDRARVAGWMSVQARQPSRTALHCSARWRLAGWFPWIGQGPTVLATPGPSTPASAPAPAPAHAHAHAPHTRTRTAAPAPARAPGTRTRTRTLQECHQPRAPHRAGGGRRRRHQARRRADRHDAG